MGLRCARFPPFTTDVLQVTIYAVQATIKHERHGCTTQQQLPVFYLDYVSEEYASRIALDILSGWNDNDDTTIEIELTQMEAVRQ